MSPTTSSAGRTLILLAVLALETLWCPSSAEAQPTQPVHRIGVLGVATACGYALQVEAF